MTLLLCQNTASVISVEPRAGTKHLLEVSSCIQQLCSSLKFGFQPSVKEDLSRRIAQSSDRSISVFQQGNVWIGTFFQWLFHWLFLLVH